jgi:subtilisin family serine protease
MKLMNWRGIGGILLVLAMLLVNSYWAAPVRAESPAQSISKVSSLLSMRIQMKTELKAQTMASASNGFLEAASANFKGLGKLNNVNSEMVYIYFAEQPSADQISDLKSLGITVYPESWIPPVGNHPNGFILAEMPTDKVNVLEAKSYVMTLDTAEKEYEYQNDMARTTMGVGSVWSGGDTGTGVTVAVLDSGIDTSNADFPTLNSSNSADYGNYPSPIDYTIANTVTGHGTHVAGSLLGRGVNSATYKGVAPGASLVFLKIGKDDGSIASTAVVGAIHAAVDTYHAKIINMSIGGWSDYHDGTEPECQAIDYATAQGAAVFVSAGNAADYGWHASGTVSANNYREIAIVAQSSDYLVNNLVWFGNTNLSLQYYNSDRVLLNPSNYGVSTSTKGTHSCFSGFNAGYAVPPGTYFLRVNNSSSTSQFFHIYYMGRNSAVAFSSPDPLYTLHSPGEADNAIAVGSYVTRKNWTDYSGQSWQDPYETSGTIATSSSRGPRVDTGAVPKPDVVAPGCYIASVRDTSIYTFPAINTHTDIPSYQNLIIDNDGLGLGVGNTGPANYILLEGTSMASPVAAGVGALLLGKNPSLTPAQVKQILQSTATDKGTAGVDTTYGYGLVNASAAVSSAMAQTTPTLISPANSANVSGTSVTYTWSAVSGATSYALYISTTSNFSSIKYNVVTSGTSVTDTGYLNNGTVYYWEVFAYNGSWGPATPVWSFTNGT